MSMILVAYDGSSVANKALEHSISIAEPNDEILILMVIPKADSFFYSEDSNEISFEDAKINLEALTKKYEHTGLKLTTEVLQGDIVKEILNASNRPNCKLIVMGYKGVSKIGRFKLGSVSGRVAKLAKKPVLIVK